MNTDLDSESDLRPLLREVVPAEDEYVARRDVRHAGQRVRVHSAAATVAIAVAAEWEVSVLEAEAVVEVALEPRRQDLGDANRLRELRALDCVSSAW